MRLIVDLKEMFDLVFFPKDDGLKQAIGQAILDQIKENAQSAKFLAGSTTKGYSKAYAESDNGIVYGKRAGAKATLTASGDMLNSIEVDVGDNPNKLVLEFSDEEESAKAHGHVTGGGYLPKRDFFGLDQADINKIRRQFDNAVSDALAIDLAGEIIEQGEETDLDFISRLLNGEG
jgi:hypothetical protein